MKILLLAVLMLATATEDKCRGIYFNNNHYNIETIKDGIFNVHQMVLNDNDNTLYFTFDQIGIPPTRDLSYINLDTRKVGLVTGIGNVTGLAIDRKKNRVYIGTSEGLFFLNQYKIPEQLPVFDNIHYLFFNKVLYFINERREAHIFYDGVGTRIPELYGIEIDKLIADDDNTLFFLENTKLSTVQNGSRVIISYNKYNVKVLVTDYYYKPYISTTNGIYVYNKYKYALDKISDIIDLKELTFNKGGEAIYVVADHILKLKANIFPCTGNYPYRRIY